MSKSKQAERHIINAGYSIYWNNFKGKAYPHAQKDGQHATASTIIKLCAQLLPHVILN